MRRGPFRAEGSPCWNSLARLKSVLLVQCKLLWSERADFFRGYFRNNYQFPERAGLKQCTSAQYFSPSEAMSSRQKIAFCNVFFFAGLTLERFLVGRGLLFVLES